MIETEVLVVGSGIAGMVTALQAAKAGARVVILHHGKTPKEKNTYWAQGGIIYTGPGDSPELLTRDILDAGAGLSLPEAARLLAEEGPRLVDEVLIEGAGVPFDRRIGGEYDITEEAAHSLPRILHCTDRTGFHINASLEAAIEAHPKITAMSPYSAIDLLTLAHNSKDPLDIYKPQTCIGVYALNSETQEVVTIYARETVLATGGLGALYLHSTNPKGARGDGIAMASRAGARLMNLEFIQFHPTAFYHERSRRFLISESMRGEGARLINHDGHEFMLRFHPQGSLAPRDVVARGIHQELLGSNQPCVFLDISHKDADWLRQRFPYIAGECAKFGIDIATDPIPVVPAAHYSCGGVYTNLDGQTSIDRLWAVGEVACTGLHGANRLASTSLLEGVVFGDRAARGIGRRLRERDYGPVPQIDAWKYMTEPSDPALILQDWLTIKYTMWNYVGLIRTPRQLARARQILRELRDEIEAFYATTRVDDALIGLRNGAQTALTVLYAASLNRRSIGCHYLTEEPISIPESKPETELKAHGIG